MNSFGKMSFTSNNTKADTTSNHLKEIYSLDKDSVIKAVLFEESGTNKILRYFSLHSILSLNNALANQPFLDVSDDDIREVFWHLRSLFDVSYNDVLSKAFTFCSTKYDVITMFAKANKRKRMSYDFLWLKDNPKEKLLAEKVHDILPEAMSNISIETALNFTILRILRFYDYLYSLKKSNINFQFDDFDFSTFPLLEKSAYHFEKNEECLENLCSILSPTFDKNISFKNYMLALNEMLSKNGGVPNG